MLYEAHHIFQVYFLLSKFRNVTTIYSRIMLIIMSSQWISYIFDKKAGYSFNDNWYSNISSLTSIIRVYSAIEETKNVSLYWIILYIFFLIFFFVCV